MIGLVVGIHIDDRFIKDGLVDTGAMQPIARLGYMDYATVTPEVMFTHAPPQRRRAGPHRRAQGGGVGRRGGV